MENPIKMDDLGVPLFLETPIYHQPKSFQVFFSSWLVNFPRDGFPRVILWKRQLLAEKT